MDERDYEAEALEQGFNPDYDGPNKVDAKTFVEKGEQIAGMAVKQSRELKSKVEMLEGRVEQLTESNKQVGDHFRQTLDKQRKNTAVRISELESELGQAVEDSDGRAFREKQREINTLRNELPPAEDPQVYAQAWEQLAAKFAADNPWYNSNPKLATFADGLQARVEADGYRGGSFFAEVERRTREAFPEEFKNPNKSSVNAVEGGGERGAGSKAHTFTNLDPESKKACDEFIRDGIFKDRAEYVASYEWEDE